MVVRSEGRGSSREGPSQGAKTGAKRPAPEVRSPAQSRAQSERWTFSRIAQHASLLLGKSGAFAAACGIVLLWAVAGPFFGYSDTWQLVVNTGTTIVTFLMVFLVQ